MNMWPGIELDLHQQDSTYLELLELVILANLAL